MSTPSPVTFVAFDWCGWNDSYGRFTAVPCGDTLIREAWMNGNYTTLGLAQWASELQRTRNVHGPTWLVRARP